MLVFDASAAAKWFRDERGSDVARGLLSSDSALDGVWMPDNCVHEVLAVVGRNTGAEAMLEAWWAMMEAGVQVAGVGEALLTEAAAVARSLGCTHYDALAPATARILGATLVSADARAHARVKGVVLV